MSYQLLSIQRKKRSFRNPLWTAAVVVVGLLLAFPAGLLYASPGVDGSLTVSAADVVLNRYSAATNISGNVVTVNDIDDLDDGGAGHYSNDNLSAGDMILIYQAQGADFVNFSNSSNYGTFSYNNAGRYEFAIVSAVTGNDITVDSSNTAPYSCGGITNIYDTAAGHVQVVRVPQYINLTIEASGSVAASDWDGETGGIAAILARNSVVVDGQVDASGSGFRGGRLDEDSYDPNIHFPVYVQTNGFYGAVKGESILGSDPEYYAHNGPYARGAPANGGGGGTAHNAGGGGGANGNGGGTWTGAGLPDTSDVSWDNAWDLDDGTDDGGTPLPAYFSDGAGGGRGGYSYADTFQDALTYGPGNNIWGGHFRRQLGGLGGRPLLNDAGNRVFFGGGGGAGEDNNETGTPGAPGGGLVIIATGSLSGSGQIISNGDDAQDAAHPYQDGAGGGGGGGSIVIKTSSAAGVTVSAAGGDGGDIGVLGEPTMYPNESFGPGGGGGGGFIALDSGSGALTLDVSGGVNGITAAEAVLEFIPNGATGGYNGNSSTADFSFPGCAAPTAITLSAATVTAHLNWWPALVFLVLLLMSRILLKGRLIPVRTRG